MSLLRKNNNFLDQKLIEKDFISKESRRGIYNFLKSSGNNFKLKIRTVVLITKEHFEPQGPALKFLWRKVIVKI